MQLLYKLYNTNSFTVWFLYQFIHFLYELYSTNSCKGWFFDFSASHEGRSPSTPPAPTRPHPAAPTIRLSLGYTRLPQPVRVRSWGGWIRNGIKVYNLYYRLPRLLGCTRLHRPLGYTRLPRPVRVRSWGGWVRNGIKVNNLYYQLPRPLGYTWLPRPLGYTRLPRYTNSYNTIRIIIQPTEKWDCTNSFVWHIVNPFL